MTKKIHQSMRRLYAAAKELSGCDDPRPAKIGRLLNVSTQTVKNWGTRGVSKQGALKAQDAIGCDAAWITDDKPGSDYPVKTIAGSDTTHMVAEPLPAPYIHQDSLIRQVIAIMEGTDLTGRSMILMAAQQALERYHPAKQTAG